MNDKTYEFDAHISVMADGSTKEEVADYILDIANSNDIAISLHEEDTLNVSRLNKQVEFLKGELNQLANFNPDWDMLQPTRETLQEHMAELGKARGALLKISRTRENYRNHTGFSTWGAHGAHGRCKRIAKEALK